jgi:hypothetical protein
VIAVSRFGTIARGPLQVSLIALAGKLSQSKRMEEDLGVTELRRLKMLEDESSRLLFSDNLLQGLLVQRQVGHDPLHDHRENSEFASIEISTCLPRRTRGRDRPARHTTQSGPLARRPAGAEINRNDRAGGGDDVGDAARFLARIAPSTSALRLEIARDVVTLT